MSEKKEHNWIGLTPLVEKAHPDGRPWFRIVEDDGCYIVVSRDWMKDEEFWRGGVIWLEPAMWDELRKLPRPRGAIYDSERDGGECPPAEEIEKLVNQRLVDRELDHQEVQERQRQEAARKEETTS